MATGTTTRHGTGPPVDEAPLEEFIQTLSKLPADEWKKRIALLEELVQSIPDHSTSANAEDGNFTGKAYPVTPSSAPHGSGGGGSGDYGNEMIPWYRSSRSVRKLSLPLKNLILDARSAVVKDATELIGTLMIVKLQPLPSTSESGDGDDANNDEGNNGDAPRTPSKATTITTTTTTNQTPPPAFVGRLLFKDLIVPILQLSAQTVNVIRTYGVNMMLDVIPHCRVKSSLVVLLEKMKSDKNRNVREDCARYLRCVLETWPADDESGDSFNITSSRKEERLSMDSARQVGNGLGRALSDPAQTVRNEAKRGFQVLFRRFRSVWNEVMNGGVIRDVRLRKNLLEAAKKSDGGNNLFDDIASLDDMSLNSLGQGSYVSMRSGASYRSYASRGMSVRSNQPGGGGGQNYAIPSVIGTPQQRARPRYGGTTGASPSYLRGTASSSTRVAERQKYSVGPSPSKADHDYSANVYVTSSGEVMATPSPRAKFHKPSQIGGDMGGATAQPFASLLRTPQHPRSSSRKTGNRHSPEMTPSWEGHHGSDYVQKSSKVLRKRLSCRITGIMPEHTEDNWNHLSSINEAEDNAQQSASKDASGAEIAAVAKEVLAAHLSHLEEMEAAVATEKKMLLDLGKQFGVLDMNGIKGSHFHGHLATLTEEQVCDYFESVHICADQQRMTSEKLLKEMENISQGGVTNGSNGNTAEKRELAQSPMNGSNLDAVQRDLDDLFDD